MMTATRGRVQQGGAVLAIAAALTAASPAAADESHAGPGGLSAEAGNAERAAYDVIHAKVMTDGRTAAFRMALAGEPGAVRPDPAGQLAGAPVHAYVWPTTLDPATVGFPSGAGILALAVTSHPDFDDTPLYDEDGDGDRGNDGRLWHSHWVVLGPDDACGEGALKVIDIAEGETPPLPATWPGLPILIDSPGWDPVFADDTLEVRVAFDDIGAVREARFDAVTSGLRVNADVHAPLLCIEDVFDVASGDLSLPGEVE